MNLKGPDLSNNFNSDIEILRFFAISFVVLGHYVHNSLAKLGGISRALAESFGYWGGVDLFFCISGYIICRSLIEQKNKNPDTKKSKILLSFWIRRCFRLYPSALATLSIILLLTHFFNKHENFGTLSTNLISSVFAALHLANFYFYSCSNEISKACGFGGYFWSLSLEEQFYFVFPFLFLFLKRYHFSLLTTLFIVSQFFLKRPNGFHENSLLWFIRCDSILLGVLIAMHQECIHNFLLKFRLSRNSLILKTFAAFLLMVISLQCGVKFAFFASTGVIALASSGLVSIASLNSSFLTPRNNVLKSAMLWIGSRSYGIYLFHVPVKEFIKEVFKISPNVTASPLQGALILTLSLALLYLVVSFNFRFIEQPFRKNGSKLSNKIQAQS